MQEYMASFIDLLVNFATDSLLPVMAVAFVLGTAVRAIIYFTIRSEFRFILEFEKRVHKYLAGESGISHELSFHELTSRILQSTYYEHFELKRKHRRRRFDNVTSVTDRIFLVQEGAARLIKDALSQTRYLKRGSEVKPKFQDISKFVVTSNPFFNKIFGFFSMGLFNDILEILPRLFVIGGIFGTFLGVMRALPELSGMDLGDASGSKVVMDAFLTQISFSMQTSIVGIFFSVLMTVINAVMSPDASYINLVNKLTSSMEFLWNDSGARASIQYQETKDRRQAVPQIEHSVMEHIFMSDKEHGHREASGKLPPDVKADPLTEEPKVEALEVEAEEDQELEAVMEQVSEADMASLNESAARAVLGKSNEEQGDSSGPLFGLGSKLENDVDEVTNVLDEADTKATEPQEEEPKKNSPFFSDAVLDKKLPAELQPSGAQLDRLSEIEKQLKELEEEKTAGKIADKVYETKRDQLKSEKERLEKEKKEAA